MTTQIRVPNGMTADKTAVLIAVHAADRFQMGGVWHSLALDWRPGDCVDAVSHFGQLVTRAGENIEVLDDNDTSATYRVESIALLDTAQMTDAEARALGFDSVADFKAREWGERDGQAWYLQLAPAGTHDLLTAAQVARMHGVARNTVHRILNADRDKPQAERRFPNAIPPETRRGEWRIPRADAERWQRDPRGRRAS